VFWKKILAQDNTHRHSFCLDFRRINSMAFIELTRPSGKKTFVNAKHIVFLK
jgi:hypothetical protein